MKKIDKLLGLGFLITLLALSCKKIDLPQQPIIDLGVKSTSTAIKSISQTGNIVTAEFETTVGSKYSVQIIPFGGEIPSKKEGFTATESVTKKVYDLSDLSKKYYDIVFIDISGNETKYPILIK
jgi:hypothetical protein